MMLLLPFLSEQKFWLSLDKVSCKKKKKIQTYCTNSAEWQFTSSLRVKGGTASLHNKIAHTGCCKWQKFIFSTLELGGPTSKCWHFWFLLKPLFLACRWLPSDRVLLWPFPCGLTGCLFWCLFLFLQGH